MLEAHMGSDPVAELYRAKHAHIADMRLAIRVLRTRDDAPAIAAFLETAWELGRRGNARMRLVDAFTSWDKRTVMVFQLDAADVSTAELIGWYDADNLVGRTVETILVERPIGSDPISNLYVGRDTTTHQLYALRVLRRELVGDGAATETLRANTTLTGGRIRARDAVTLPDGRLAVVFLVEAEDATPEELVAFYSRTSGPSDPTENVVGAVLDGRYQIVQHIGSDAISELYLARHMVLADMRLAIRVMHRELVHDLAARNAFIDRPRAGTHQRMSVYDFSAFPAPDGRLAMIVQLEANGVTADEIFAHLRTDPLIGQTIGSYEIVDHFGFAHEANLYSARHTHIEGPRFVIRVMNTVFVGNRAATEAFMGTARALSKARSTNHRFSVVDFIPISEGRPGMVFSLDAADVHAREIIDFARAHTPITTTERAKQRVTRRHIVPSESIVGQTVMDGRFVVTEHVGSDPHCELYTAQDRYFPNGRSVLRVLRLEHADNSDVRRSIASGPSKNDDHRIRTGALFNLDDGRIVIEYQLITADLDPDAVIDWYMTYDG